MYNKSSITYFIPTYKLIVKFCFLLLLFLVASQLKQMKKINHDSKYNKTQLCIIIFYCLFSL